MKVTFRAIPRSHPFDTTQSTQYTCTFYMGDTDPGDSEKENFDDKCDVYVESMGDVDSLNMGEDVDVEVEVHTKDGNDFRMDFVEVVTADNKIYRVDSPSFQQKDQEYTTGWHKLDFRGLIKNKGLKVIEDKSCYDIKPSKICETRGICKIGYYCSQCQKTCGQCRDKDICMGKSKECNLQPFCHDYCFDKKNEAFCNKVKLEDRCNRIDQGCLLCSKTCGTCHGGNEICPLKCRDLDNAEFCKDVIADGKCGDDELLHRCTKTCTNCTESILVSGH